jgi:rhodanese-related sulfurtransferase
MNSSRIILLLLALSALPVVSADQPPASPASSREKPLPPNNVRNVGVEEFDKLRSAKNTIVLDVRTEKEFNAGHIPGAVNLDYNSPDFAKKVADLDKSKTYLVHCAAGVRSARACTAMDKLAFTNLVNLESGFKAWEKAGKPVEKK